MQLRPLRKTEEREARERDNGRTKKAATPSTYHWKLQESKPLKRARRHFVCFGPCRHHQSCLLWLAQAVIAV